MQVQGLLKKIIREDQTDSTENQLTAEKLAESRENFKGFKKIIISASLTQQKLVCNWKLVESRACDDEEFYNTFSVINIITNAIK